MIVATIALFAFMALFGGCGVSGFGDFESMELSGFLYFSFGTGVATVVLWLGKWIEEDNG